MSLTLAFPKLPFPGDAPGAAYPLSYLGNSYTFDSGLLTERVGDWLHGIVYDRWNRYDYEHQHQMTEQEAELLGLQAEILIVTPNIAALVAADAYLMDCVTKNLGSALVALCLPPLAAAEQALAAAQAQLASDSAAWATASEANAAMAGDQGALADAQEQLAADQAAAAGDDVLADDQTAIDTLQAQLDADTAAAAPLAALTTAVQNDQAAATAASTQIAALQAQIAALETQFA